MAEDFKYNRFEGMSPMKKAMLILSEGAMAFGEGIGGGKPYSKYMDMQGQQAKMAYDKWKTNRELPTTQTINQGKVAESLQKQVELGVKTPEQAMAEYQQMFANQGTAPYGVAPSGMGGVPTGVSGGGLGMFPTSLDKKSAELALSTQKEVSSQESKAAALGERDYLRVSSTADTNLQQFYGFANEQLNNLGVRAGDLLGAIDKLTPRQLNSFKEAFGSSSKEASATVARALIPNMRAIQGAIMFKGSTANIGSTLAGSINNVAGTMGNAFGSALSNNIVDVDESGNKVSIQDIAIDQKTGKPLSKLPVSEKVRAINDLKKDFVRQYKLLQYAEAFKVNPKLLTSKELKDFKEAFPSDLRFDSVKDAEKADIPKGTMVVINGVLQVKE